MVGENREQVERLILDNASWESTCNRLQAEVERLKRPWNVVLAVSTTERVDLPVIDIGHSDHILTVECQQLAANQQTMQQLQARLDDVNVKDSVKTREINLLVDENKRLHARVKELEDREWVAALFMDDVDNTAQVQAIQGLQVRVKELEAVKELSDWVDKQMQAGLVVAHEFVHGCGLFDGIDAGKCVIETAARYGWQFKQRADRLQADLDSWQKQAEIQADSLRTAQAEVERLKKIAHEALEQLSVVIIGKSEAEQQLAEQRAEVDQLQAEVEHLKDELRAVDEALDRRNALDFCKTRAEKVYLACRIAGENDPAGKIASLIQETREQVQAIQGLQAEVSDEERWMREVLTDFRIPFDDHKVGRRYAMSCWMQELQAEVERLKTISLCRCGDHFTAEDPGTCGNCLATYYQDRVKTGTVMAKVDR